MAKVNEMLGDVGVRSTAPGLPQDLGDPGERQQQQQQQLADHGFHALTSSNLAGKNNAPVIVQGRLAMTAISMFFRGGFPG
eukprot:5975188-Prorocentrum_lima.AAC.1